MQTVIAATDATQTDDLMPVDLWEEHPPLSPLPGEICEQYVRCGKPNCRCNDGHLHGPYHYRVWREGARVFKQYVKPAELEATRERCRLHRAMFGKRRRGPASFAV